MDYPLAIVLATGLIAIGAAAIGVSVYLGRKHMIPKQIELCLHLKRSTVDWNKPIAPESSFTVVELEPDEPDTGDNSEVKCNCCEPFGCNCEPRDAEDDCSTQS